uniref:Testis expressed 53 n=1 Tax=Rousettus aegyptiacus TaxID=9407 RepID=A0A7J8IUT0_ROUAE|nr:testis expressed 53 [Rousettus aegyptiacus]
MASKIFCCCCQADEGASPTGSSYNQRMSQQHHPRAFDLNANSHKNSLQKRYPHQSTNNRGMKTCTYGRP